jgi:hypothetical protein
VASWRLMFLVGSQQAPIACARSILLPTISQSLFLLPSTELWTTAYTWALLVRLRCNSDRNEFSSLPLMREVLLLPRKPILLRLLLEVLLLLIPQPEVGVAVGEWVILLAVLSLCWLLFSIRADVAVDEPNT